MFGKAFQRKYALTDQGVIYNKRGIGFFVTENAAQNIRKDAKDKFLKEELPQFAEKAQLLYISKDEIMKLLF